MKQKKNWRVVLDEEKAPAVGSWVAIDGLVPGEEETARFMFLDGTHAEGFTFLEEPPAPGHWHSWADREARHANGKIPWLDFPDCMEIVGVQHLNWCPERWTGDARLWLLTVESLASNLEFEKRLDEEYRRRRKTRSMLRRIRDWWPYPFAA